MTQDPRDRVRRIRALALNVIAPGVALVILRREWLGLTVALLFTLLAQVALWGLLLLPAGIPVEWSVVSGIAAGVVWVGAQWLGWASARTVHATNSRNEAGRLST